MKTEDLEPSPIEDIEPLLADKELKESLERAEADFAAGRCRPSSQVFREMEEKYPWLREDASAEEEKLTPFTMEELEAEIAESEADIAAGRVMTSEQVFREMEEKYPWLRKDAPAEEEKLTPYTMEEIYKRLDEAEADIAAGRVISSEEMHRRMRKYLSTL